MSRLRGIALFAYDFVVGDDWRLLLAVVLGLIASGLLAGHGVAAWWLLPAVVMVALGVSLRRAARGSGGRVDAASADRVGLDTAD